MSLSGLPKLLKDYLKQVNCWEAKNALSRMTWENYGADLVGRTLRGLEERSVIAVRYDGARSHAFYRYIPEDYRDKYIPSSQRPIGKENELWKVPIADGFPKRILGYETVLRDGRRLAKPIYG
jgi:hypothetical protein